MPTAAKLFAAVFMAATGWITATLALPYLSDRIGGPLPALVAAAVGGQCGWAMLGPAVGRGYGMAIGTGMRTALTAMVLCLAGYSFLQMLRLAMRLQYDNLSKALVGFLREFLTLGGNMLQADVLIPLALCAMVSGVMAEYAGRRWT